MHDTQEDRLVVVDLSQRYIALMRDVGAGPSLAAVSKQFAQLIRRYRSKERFFHTPHRLLSCMQEFDQVISAAEEPNTILMAIFYRSIVFDARRVDNEAESAKYFEFVAKHVLDISDPSFVLDVRRMIRLTSPHSIELPSSCDECLLCDINSAILGADAPEYARFVRDLRREYSFFTDQEWAMVRSRFIDNALEQDVLYHTTTFYERYEENAKVNLMQERFALERDLPVF